MLVIPDSASTLKQKIGAAIIVYMQVKQLQDQNNDVAPTSPTYGSIKESEDEPNDRLLHQDLPNFLFKWYYLTASPSIWGFVTIISRLILTVLFKKN